MTLHAPQNPFESDDTFYKVLQHSHEQTAGSVVQSRMQAVPSELDKLSAQWKRGKMPYHEYMVKKYSIERASRTWQGKRKSFS